jgi:hypothetical protein
MNIQTSLDFTGRQNRDAGMKKAIQSAEQVCEGWSEKAFQLFKWYLSSLPEGKRFLIEDFREEVKDKIPAPRSSRAYGSIAMRAVKLGLIERVGYTQVKNPKARMANASVWVKRYSCAGGASGFQIKD